MRTDDTRSDEEILAALDEEGTECLLMRYKDFVRRRARSYFLAGGEAEDLIQEGMIGLFKAIRDYSPDKNALFRTFAEMCIERQMITAVKGAARKKHAPLNTYVSYDRNVGGEDDGRSFLEVLGAADESPSPEDEFIGRERRAAMEKRIDELLSPFEKQVLGYYTEGADYRRIASLTGKTEKSVDNALQRIKRKINRIIGKD